MKKFLLIALAAIILVSIIFSFSYWRQESKKITGNEWLFMQWDICLEDLKVFSESLDSVVTMYIMGSLDPIDFANELDTLEAQYDIIHTRYLKLQQNHPIKEGTHTYVSKQGSESMENCYTYLFDLFDTLKNNGHLLSPDETAYQYLAYRQKITHSISAFITAIMWAEESMEA